MNNNKNNSNMKTINLTNRNQNLDIYFNEIKNFSNLTEEDEKTLFVQVANGNQKAVETICNKMYKFVVAIAKTYTSDAEKLEDLIQEGNIGLLEAIYKFDVENGNRFSSFAVWYIRHSIREYLGTSDGVVETNNVNTLEKVRKLKKDFYKTYEREMSDDEVIDALEEMGENISDRNRIRESSFTSIDQATMFEEGETLMSECGQFAQITASGNDYMDDVDDEYNKYQVNTRMAGLTEREQLMIEMHFGLGGGVPMDVEAIAEKLGSMGYLSNRGKVMCGETVRVAIDKALKKMQAEM